jgi:hypothetical protein
LRCKARLPEDLMHIVLPTLQQLASMLDTVRIDQLPQVATEEAVYRVG